MAIEISVIVGSSNSGKSSLTRSLSGIGKTSHSHPNAANVVKLNWNGSDADTVIIQSSFNEGQLLMPAKIGPRLDDYEQHHGVSRAIVCISTSVKSPNIADYVQLFDRTGVLISSNGKHTLRDIVPLRGPQRKKQNYGAWPIRPHPVQPYITQNLVARSVRQLLGL